MSQFETITFADESIDRAAHLRKADAQAGVLTDKAARSMVLWRGKPLFTTTDIPALTWLPMDHPILRDADESPFFLGLEQGQPRFATDISGWQDPQADADQIAQFLDASQNIHPAVPDSAFMELRGLMALISASDAGSAATARAVWAWHGTHRHCARCGAGSEVADAGWQRRCADCGATHFPRTDPVVIMLVLSGNKVLMGRSPGWPEGMYSLLAGFVEPGECIEAAVRRETVEEAGIKVGRVGYLASQPWPFPASLMIGCWAEATSTEIKLDPIEIDDAIWMTREEIMAAQSGTHPNIKPARKGALAHHLLHMWLRGEAGIPDPCT
ncbi:NAD(+) diphosphatase [Halovulum sp. GXIMD14793]